MFNYHFSSIMIRFDTLINKLGEIKWESITSVENEDTINGNLVEDFGAEVFIELYDKHPVGFNASSGTYGAASSLRETGEVAFNFKFYDDKQQNFLTGFHRVRINQVWGNIALLPCLTGCLNFRSLFTFSTPVKLQAYISLQKAKI